MAAIMARLRDPADGCPWDVAQDFASIAPFTIEEAYEVADAIERGDMGALKDELGDLALQVVFHARMAEEAGHFALTDALDGISDRWSGGIRMRSATAPAGMTAGKAIKAGERGAKGERGTLDGVAVSLPALLRAGKLASVPGFSFRAGR